MVPPRRHFSLTVWIALTGLATAQQQFAELGKRQLPPDADTTAAVACRDVDGDSDLDLLLANEGQNRLLLNDGTGDFTDVTASHLPSDNDLTRALSCCDVDGDGDLDLVLGNHGQNRLYLNDGRGSYTDVTGTHMPADNDRTEAVVACDVDGDGDLDLAVGNDGFFFGAQSRLYLNNGQGFFADATATNMPLGGWGTRAVAACDVDGDGDQDLVLGNVYRGNSAIEGEVNLLYLNDGAGIFTDATVTNMPFDAQETAAVLCCDVDGDGDVDLIFGNGASSGGRNLLCLNNGAGVFAAASSHLPPDDLATQSIACSDVDNDGDLDLVLANSGSPDLLYLNDGAGTFTVAGAARMPLLVGLTDAVACGDVDGDGAADLVFGVRDQRNRLLLNDGFGTFADTTATRLPPTVDFTFAVAGGDVDGDGDRDLIFSTFHGNRLLANDGTGSFTDTGGSPAGFANRAVALCDVDADGDLDLVVGRGNGTSAQPGLPNKLYRNDGTGTFTEVTAGRLPGLVAETRAVLCCDVDGDGDPDLVIGNQGSQNHLHLNDGTGTFTDATARLPVDVDETVALASCDVDGDGDLDLVLANAGAQNRLYRNDGAGSFVDATADLPVDADDTLAVAACDVDGDGDLDLLLGNDGQQNRLYRNDGAGRFTDVTQASLPADTDATRAVACCDLDDDGAPDLVLGNRGQDRVYRNDGAGRFTDVTGARMPARERQTNAVLCCDLDGDGDAELVFGDAPGAGRIYFNLLRQLDAPQLLRTGHDYRLDVYARHGAPRLFDVALPALSDVAASAPLPPFGTLGLAPSRMVVMPAFLVPQPAGEASMTIAVPNDPALADLAVFAQALLVQYPLQAHLTNVVADAVRGASPPVITSVSPEAAAAGAVVTVHGAGFDPNLRLTIDGVILTPLAIVTTRVTFAAPGLVACGATLTITNPNGDFASAAFNVPPVITSVEPSIVPVPGGTPLRIRGTNFVAGSSVTIGGRAAAVTSAASDQLDVTVPPGVLGAAAVVVTTPTSCAASSTLTYAAPSISAVSPRVAAPGVVVTVTGQTFHPGLTLDINGALLTPLSITATSVTFTAPVTATCDSVLTITNPGGTFAATPFNPSPTIFAILLPNGAPSAGGTSMVIAGANFIPGTQVTVGGTPATVRSTLASSILVTLPPGTPGPAAVVVTTPLGCSATGSMTYTP